MYLWNIRDNMEDIRRRKEKVNWGKLEREMNNERLWTLRNKQGFRGRKVGRLGEPGGGY